MNFFQRKLEKLEETAAALEGKRGYFVRITWPDACAPPGSPLPYVTEHWNEDD